MSDNINPMAAALEAAGVQVEPSAPAAPPAPIQKMEVVEAVSPATPPVMPAMPENPKTRAGSWGNAVKIAIMAKLMAFKKAALVLCAVIAFGLAAMVGAMVFTMVLLSKPPTQTSLQLHQGLKDGGIWDSWRFNSASKTTTISTSKYGGGVESVTLEARGKTYDLTPQGWVPKK